MRDRKLLHFLDMLPRLELAEMKEWILRVVSISFCLHSKQALKLLKQGICIA